MSEAGSSIGATDATPTPRSSFWPLLRFEWTKMWGRRLSWVPFLVLGLIAMVVVAVCHRLEFSVQRKLFMSFHFIFKAKEFVNGYYVTVYSLNLTFQMMMPIFISVVSGIMVAGESENGTLRACLIRPVTRARLLLSKFVVLYVYCIMLSTFVLLFLLGAGALNFGLGDLYVVNRFFNNEDGISVIASADVPFRLFLAGTIATLGMMVLGALALLISALVDTAAMSFVLTLSAYFATLALRLFPFLDWLYPYLFVTHMMRWQQCFFTTVKTDEIVDSIWHLLAYLAAFLTAAILLFQRRDIKS